MVLQEVLAGAALPPLLLGQVHTFGRREGLEGDLHGMEEEEKVRRGQEEND